MATEFTLPDLGENITSGDVVSVLVKAGDVVEPGQSVLEVETDKAVIEVPCPPGGVIQEVLVKKGETVNVGQALLSLGGSAAQPAAAPPVEKSAEPEIPTPAVKPSEPAVVEQPVPVPAASASVAVAAANGEATNNASPSETINPAGPAVRRLARELGVDLVRFRKWPIGTDHP